MKLAILYGLKKKVRRFPNEDPQARVLGTFVTPDAAVEFVNAGGLPKGFPYYAVAIEEGNFWVVDSTAEWSGDRAQDPGLQIILAGPFDGPRSAMKAQIMIKRGSVQCTSVAWSDKCERREVPPEIRPPIDWAKARLDRWSKADDVGESEIALAETSAFMEVVRDWLGSGTPGADEEYEKELLEVGKKIAELHTVLHARCAEHRRKARETREKLKRDKAGLN